MMPSALLVCPGEGGNPNQDMKTPPLTLTVGYLFLDKPYRLPVVLKTQCKTDCLGWIYRLMKSTIIAFSSRFCLRRKSIISSQLAA